MTYIVNYETTVLVIGLVRLMQLVQLLVADISAIRSGKTPGRTTGVSYFVRKELL
jgi:hypothetical protein